MKPRRRFAVNLKHVTSTQDLLDERYGRSKPKVRRQLILWRTVAATLVVAFLTWGITVAIAEGEKIGFESDSFTLGPTTAEISIRLANPKTIKGPVICAVQALNQSYAIVGYREVTIAAKDASVEQKVKFNVTEDAVTVVVDHCWRG